MTAKADSIIRKFKISFGSLLGKDGKIAIAGVTAADDTADLELSIAEGLDPEQVKAYVDGPDYINPAINRTRYDQFFRSAGLPVQPGYCTFEPYVENQRVHIRIDATGVPFDMGA